MRALKPLAKVGTQSAKSTFKQLFKDRYNEDPSNVKKYLLKNTAELYGDKDDISALLELFDSYRIDSVSKCECKKGKTYVISLFNEGFREYGTTIVVYFGRVNGNTWLIHNILHKTCLDGVDDIIWKSLCGKPAVGSTMCKN